MQGISKCLYMLTRKPRFLAGSVLKLMNTQVKTQKPSHFMGQTIKLIQFRLFIRIIKYVFFYRRRHYALLGSFNITKNCKIRSPIIQQCLAHWTPGCCTGCVAERTNTNTSNTLPMLPVVRPPESMIHSR